MWYTGYHNGIHVLISLRRCPTPISFWDRQISWLEGHSANGIYFLPVSLEGKHHGDSRECRHHFHARRSPPSVDFYLYDEFKEMSLYDFCVVCKLPLEGNVEEPHPSDVADFIDKITVGGNRKVSNARTTSIHFLVLRYYAIFASRCLIGRGNGGGLSAPDLAILRHALFRDRTFSLVAMVAKRLSLNHTKGPILEVSLFASC